ncbi:hypothetical protein [Bordetella trematum]|uniref:hypothetical protein n=1 Tax=Bordetella trematum TaxID=123899 RepID=UPI003AF3F86A
MAIFKVSARDGSVSLVIRARCISCARQIAVQRSPSTEVRLWRDPARSAVALIENPEQYGYLREGRQGFIERIQHGER